MPFAQSGGTTGEVRAEAAGLNDRDVNAQRCHFARQNFGKTFDTPFRGRIGPAEGRLFGKWCSGDKVCEIWRCEPLNVSNAEIPKNVVNCRHRFLTNDIAKASFKSVLECQPRKCG